jgi:hypothetical protein
MNRILAKRYAFCDFSSIAGFPNQVPTRDEWENSLPKFRGEEWEVPAEHLLDFHEFINRLEIVHDDVQIKLFKFSLEGIALDWCRSLPDASVSSLADFHAAFHVFCKDHFPADLLYPQCCHEFNLSKLELQEEYAAEENTLHHDQEINDSHYDNLSDAFDIISNASTVVSCHDDQIFISENFEDVEQTDRFASDSFRSAEVEEDSLPFPDLQGLSNLQLEHENHDQECVDVVVDTSHESLDPNNREDPNPRVESAAHVMSSSHFLNLQEKVDHNTYEESDGGKELKSPDQQSVLYVFQTDLEQPAFNSEISKDSFQHLFNLQLDQQSKEVLLCKFDDPFADYLEPISSMNVKIFMSEEDSLIHLLKPFFCMIWSLLLFGSRFNMMSVDQFLTWLHWKSSFT